MKENPPDWHQLEQTIDDFEMYLHSRKGSGESFPVSLYADCIRPAVDYYLSCQDGSGAVIDPESGREWHYSTPCFAQAAAYLASRGEERYLEPAVRALKQASRLLAGKNCPQGHPNFFLAPLMTAHSLVSGIADAADVRQWEAHLRSLDPWEHFSCDIRDTPPTKIHNWNAITLAGEYRRFLAGWTENTDYIESHIGFHTGRLNDTGWYRDGDLTSDNLSHPTAYDLVGRSHLTDLINEGWEGKGAGEIRKALLKGVLVQLFFQDPNGEYQCTGRSAQHVWNGAVLAHCAEWGARQYKENHPELAAALRRQAQLALNAISGRIMPEGRYFIVNNRFRPEERQGYEAYSNTTTYNMFTLAALVNAALTADETITVSEIPSEHFSYAVRTGKDFHLAAMASGGYFAVIDYCADPETNPAGLSRVVRKGRPSEIGPSEGGVGHPRFSIIGEAEYLAHTPSWKDRSGHRHDLAGLIAEGIMLDQPGFYAPKTELSSDPADGTAEAVLTWRGGFYGARKIKSSFRISADGLSVCHEVEGSVTDIRAGIPVFVSDGVNNTKINLHNRKIEVRVADHSVQTEILQGEKPVLEDSIIGSRIGFLKRVTVCGENTVEYHIRIV